MGDAASLTPPPIPEEPSDFHITAVTSLAERRPRTLKHGDTFAVLDHYGDMASGPHSSDGLYHADTRHLSQLKLRINGIRPLLLASTSHDDNAVLAVHLANPEVRMIDGSIMPAESVYLLRTKFLWNGGCYERIGLRNYDIKPRTIVLSLSFDADFADVFEVRGHRRAQRGHRLPTLQTGDGVALRYRALDGVECRTDIAFFPRPHSMPTDHAIYQFSLAPGERQALFVTVQCGEVKPPRDTRFYVALRAARRSLRRVTDRTVEVSTSNALFNRAERRSTADLAMLTTETPHGLYPYAGIPWFSTAFGRDGLITAMELLWADPEIARGTLRYLAATQADRVDPDSDAEPGKILHETRRGEMARLGEVPFGLYYGSVDSTPLFVMLAGLYFTRTGDLDTLRALWPNIEAALRWIDRFGDRDGDGFVEYARSNEHGLVNQGWKDSSDSVFHQDGTLARGPIALCEVQGYVFAAKRQAAIVARALGRLARSDALEREAESLKRRFEDAFWCEDIGTYALALDGDKRPCRIRTSNAGHALFTGIASPEHAACVGKTLMGHESFSGWGIRTLAAGEARYNPMSYHNGSIWPHDNALIAQGFARYGMKPAATKLFRGLFDAATYMDLCRLPELFCGMPRRRRQGPTSYPVACSPQAWAAASPFALLQACLGIECDAMARELRLRSPSLPPFLDDIVLRNLRLAGATIDLHLWRSGSEVAVDVAKQSDTKIDVLVIH